MSPSTRCRPGGGGEACGAVKTHFEEVNGYNKAKFSEYEAQKKPYSEKLRLQTEREQKQLAAKYAAAAGARSDLTTDDIYYTGLLHWIAENLDMTGETLRRFLAAPGPAADKAQTARSIVAVAAAKQRKFEEAQTFLTDYLANKPIKLSDRARMESELAKAYSAEKNAEAAAHSAEAFRRKAVLLEGGVTQRGLDETLDAGMQLFESHRAAGNAKEADAALADLRGRRRPSARQSLRLCGRQADHYMIETGRKPQAMENYLNVLIRLERASDKAGPGPDCPAAEKA